MILCALNDIEYNGYKEHIQNIYSVFLDYRPQSVRRIKNLECREFTKLFLEMKDFMILDYVDYDYKVSVV